MSAQPMVTPMELALRYQPAGRLVPVLAASDHVDASGLALRMGRFAASLGETVLIIDDRGGEVMDRAGVVYARTLADVVAGRCQLRDALYVTANEHFSMLALNQRGSDELPLIEAVGTLAALSLDFDWVFAVPPAGLRQPAALLASGSDACVLGFETEGTGPDRAFWMLDAIRSRNPRFDPFTLSFGPGDAVASALRLDAQVRDHLGGTARYSGHESDRDRVETLLESMRRGCLRVAAA